MASYRPYPPPQSSFAPSQNPNSLPPPPHPPPPRGQFAGGWGYADGSNYQIPPNSNYHHQPPFTSSSRPPQPPAQPPPPYQYTPQPPPPPPPDSSYPAQPPQPPSQPPGMYYPTSSQHLYPQPETAPPPPPSEPPPSSLIPPPPPQGSPTQPPPPQSKESSAPGRKPHDHYKRAAPRERESTQLSHGVSDKLPMKPPAAVMKRSNGSAARMETEEERRLRKKREYEKLQQEKHRQQLKEQNMPMQKTQNMASSKGHGSIVGSRLGDKRAAPLLSGERTENRLKKPTTFLCKMKFRNELPDASAPMKLMSMKKDKDRYSKYTITSLEKMWKPQLYVEPDLGIPLDLLDLSVYNPPSAKPSLAPEDEELLRDDDVVTPIKKDGIRKKERPTDKGVSWLVKTQYISPLSLDSAKQSLTEKQAKELRELKGGRNILENVNSRERQIKDIETSFEACKLRPMHATNKNLYPVEVLPLFPDFDRFNDRFVLASFDNAPTVDSEIFNKMDQSVRDEHESRALMKSYVANGSDPSQPEKFLAYMVPSTDELSKDMLDEEEDINYSWIREYNWDVRGDDTDDLTTYFVSFDDDDARYVPLPTKLTLRKKRAKEGRSTDEVEHFPVPASITVRQRPTAAAIELKEESGGYSNLKGKAKMMRGMDDDEGLDSPERYSRPQEMEEQSSGAEEYSD